MEFMATIIIIALSIFVLFNCLDWYLVKVGKVMNKDAYTLDDITIMKHKGFLYNASAYKRFTKVPEVAGIGYRKQQKIYSEL